MSGTLWKVAKTVAVGGVFVYVIGTFAGPASTANFVSHSVHGVAWGVGVLAGSAPEAGVGAQEGMAASKVAANP